MGKVDNIEYENFDFELGYTESLTSTVFYKENGYIEFNIE